MRLARLGMIVMFYAGVQKTANVVQIAESAWNVDPVTLITRVTVHVQMDVIPTHAI